MSLAGGVTFPTGETKEKNSVGTLFEPELQPGSGSFDYILGGIYQQNFNRVELIGNTSYVFNSEGAQSFRYGDVFTAAAFADYLLNPSGENFKVKAGVDATFQYEQKQKEDGVKMADSGGASILAGPTLKVEVNRYVSVFSSFLAPVYQDLGGVHQELDYEWRAGGKILW